MHALRATVDIHYIFIAYAPKGNIPLTETSTILDRSGLGADEADLSPANLHPRWWLMLYWQCTPCVPPSHINLFFFSLCLPSLVSLSFTCSKYIHVKIIDDEEYEKNKNFFLELAEPRMVDMSLQKGTKASSSLIFVTALALCHFSLTSVASLCALCSLVFYVHVFLTTHKNLSTRAPSRIDHNDSLREGITVCIERAVWELKQAPFTRISRYSLLCKDTFSPERRLWAIFKRCFQWQMLMKLQIYFVAVTRSADSIHCCCF